MTVLRCQKWNCLHVFKERDAKVKRVCDGPEEFWGVTILSYSYENRCPVCYGSQLDEVWLCIDCGENTQEEGFDRCMGCQEQHEVASAEHEADSRRDDLLTTIVDIARTVT